MKDPARKLIIRHYAGPAAGPVEVRDVVSDIDGSKAGMVSGLVVPFGRVIEIWPGMWEVVSEGALDRTLKHRADQIPLTLDHDPSVLSTVGLSQSWRKDPAVGQHGTFRLSATSSAQDARRLTAEGLIAGLSIGFYDIRSTTEDVEGGVLIRREEIALDHVSLVREPAYPEAGVDEVRHNPDGADPAEPDAELASQLAAHGYDTPRPV